MILDKLFSAAFLISLFSATIRMAGPISLAALGEIFSERSGVLNLGLEGIMLLGAFAGFWGFFVSHSLAVGILMAMFSGGLLALLMAYLTVTLNLDQVLCGLGIFLFGTGMARFLNRLTLGGSTTPAITPALLPVFPLALRKIPWIGPIIFGQNILIYLSWILILIAFFVFSRTSIGLRIKAVGENPRAADTIGLNVKRIRYACVILSGMLGGLAGMMVSVGSLGMFRENVTLGRGFIAIAIVAFGRWYPFRTFLGAIVFGWAYAFQLRMQTFNMPIPHQFMFMFPYILIILVMVLSAKGYIAPRALGTNYNRDES